MLSDRSLPWALAGLAAAIVTLPWAAEASDPFLVIPPPELAEQTPAYRYANMAAQAALDELDRRKVLYQQVEPHGAVRTPIRLTGKLHGVHIHSALSEYERPTTPFEICDARFALALDDFSALLARHAIVELVHFTMYRPSFGRPTDVGSKFGPGWLTGSALAKKTGTTKKGRRGSATRTNSRGKRPVKRSNNAPPASSSSKKNSQSRHPLGLAIDSGVFVKRDGSVLSVASHFRGTIGAQTCGAGAKTPTDPRGRELWAIVCETYQKKIFTYVLTPNFDQPHHDHLHMDIKPGVRWFLYH